MKAEKSYRDKVSVIVRRNVHAFSQFNISISEQLDIAKTWSELLCDVIPEDRLMDTWQLAFENHKSNFALTAIDLKKTWNQISEKEAAEKIEAELIRQNPIDICSNKASHINGEGRVLVVNPFNFNEEIELPCRVCRLDAYEQQRQEFVQKNGEAKLRKNLRIK